MFDPEPCAYCREMINKGDLRHSLVPYAHYRCAIKNGAPCEESAVSSTIVEPEG